MIEYRERDQPVEPVAAASDEQTIDDVRHRLSTRTNHRLNEFGVLRLRDLAVIPDRELLKVRNFGKGSLRELRAVVPYREDWAAWRALGCSLDGYGRMVRVTAIVRDEAPPT